MFSAKDIKLNMTGFRLVLLFFSVLCIPMGNCRSLGDGTTSTEDDLLSSTLTALQNQKPNEDTFKSFITNPAKDLANNIVETKTYFSRFKKSVGSSSWNPLNKLRPSWLDKKKNQLSSTLTSLQNQMPNVDTFKSSITNPAKDLANNIVETKTYFSRFKKSVGSSSWNPLNKLRPSWLDKKKNQLSSTLTSLQNQMPNVDTFKSSITNPAKDLANNIVETKTYFSRFKKSVGSSSWNPLNKLRPSWLDKKKNQLSSTLTSLQNQMPNVDTFKASITNPAKDLANNIVETKTYFSRFKKSVGSSSWNPLNKLRPSWLDKKNNQLSSTLTSLQNQMPNEDTFKSYITNPAKSLVNNITEPKTYSNIFKTSINSLSWNPVNKLKPSWLGKKKNQLSSTLTSLKSQMPNEDTFKSYITNPAKDLIPNIEVPKTYFNGFKESISSLSSNPLNKLKPSWLGKKKNQLSSTLTSLKNQMPNEDTFKSYITNPAKDLIPNIEVPKTYFNGFKESISSLSSNPLNKLKPSWLGKKKNQLSSTLTSLKNQMPNENTLKSYITNPAKDLIPNIEKPKTYFNGFKESISSLSSNTLNKLQPSWLGKKKNQLSSTLTSLKNHMPNEDTFKSYITNPAKDLIPNIEKPKTYFNGFKESISSLSSNTLNKLQPSGLGKKKNQLSSTLTSLKSQMPNEDTFKSYITDPAKDLIPNIEKPKTYFNGVKESISSLSSNTLNKLQPSGLGKKKNQLSSTLTSLKNQIPNEDTFKSYITNPAKDLIPNIEKPKTYFNGFKESISSLSSNTLNKLLPSWLGKKKNQLSSTLTSLKNQMPNEDTFKSYITNPAKDLVPNIEKPKTYFNGFKESISSLSSNTLNKLLPSWLGKKENQLSSTLTSLKNQMPNEDTFKSYITNPAKDLVPNIEKPKTYFNGFKESISSLSSNTLNKLQPSWLGKKKNQLSSTLTSLKSQMPNEDTFKSYITNPAKDLISNIEKSKTYFNGVKESISSLSSNTLNKLQPSGLGKKKNQLSSTLTSLKNQIPNEDTFKSYITNPAKDLIPNIEKPKTYFYGFKESISSLSSNTLNKLQSSWLGKKKNKLSSTLTSLKNQMPNEDTFKSYITNPAKDLVPNIEKPKTYFNGFKESISSLSSNTLNKRQPSWLGKKKNQLSSTLTSLKSHMPNEDTFKSYITNPAKDLIPNIEKPKTYFNGFKESISSLSSNTLNKLQPFWLGKKKNQISLTLTSLQNQIAMPNKDTFKSYITGPAKDLVQNIGEPSTDDNLNKNALKTSSWNPLNKPNPPSLSKKKNTTTSFSPALPSQGKGLKSNITVSITKSVNRSVRSPMANQTSSSVHKITIVLRKVGNGCSYCGQQVGLYGVCSCCGVLFYYCLKYR